MATSNPSARLEHFICKDEPAAVIHGREALSERTLERLLHDLEERRGQPVWNTNQALGPDIVQACAPVMSHPTT